jgi:hypothetical protein
MRSISADTRDLLIVLAALATLAIVHGAWRYRTIVNPLSVGLGYRTGVTTILSAIVAIVVSNGMTFGEKAAQSAILVSCVHVLGTWAAYCTPGQAPRRWYALLLRACHLDKPSIGARFRWSTAAGFFLGGLLAFVGLAIVGGGGALWLTSPRQAYLTSRAGAGPFYAATQWAVTLGLAYVLWSKRLRGWRMWAWVGGTCLVMAVTGSKGIVLTLIVVSLVYRHFCVKPLTLIAGTVFALAGALLFATLLVVQGSGIVLFDAVRYFQDYFSTSAQMLDRFAEIGFRHGNALLSNFWALVPRGLVSDKPYVYGPTLIHDTLFPGSAAAGHTPGFLDWTMPYLDFGVVGVAVFAFLDAMIQRAAYEYFLEHRTQFVAFLLATHLSIWTVWLFVPYVSLLPFVAVIALYLRLRWASTPVPATIDPGPAVPRSPI